MESGFVRCRGLDLDGMESPVLKRSDGTVNAPVALDQGHIAKLGRDHLELQVVETVWMTNMVPMSVRLIDQVDPTPWKRMYEMVVKCAPIASRGTVHVSLPVGGQVTTKGWTRTF